MFNVTEKAMRPASKSRTCFYCGQPIGYAHKASCVLIKRKIRIQATIELDVEVPSDWDEDMIKFYYNEGSWCASNLADIIENNGCICKHTEIEVLHVSNSKFLKEV